MNRRYSQHAAGLPNMGIAVAGRVSVVLVAVVMLMTAACGTSDENGSGSGTTDTFERKVDKLLVEAELEADKANIAQANIDLIKGRGSEEAAEAATQRFVDDLTDNANLFTDMERRRHIDEVLPMRFCETCEEMLRAVRP